MSVSTTTRTLLNWHQERRVRGIPTVTVLAGPTNLGLRAWRGWAAPRSASVALATPGLDLGLGWVSDVLASSSGVDHARSWLARVTNRTLDAVVCDTERVTRYDLERLWQSLPIDPTRPAAQAAFLLLAAHAAGTPHDPSELVQQLSDGTRTAGQVGVFRGLCGLYPEDRWAPLLVVYAPGHPLGFDRLISSLECIAAAVPGLPVAVAAPREVCEAATADTRSHAAAVAREGIIVVEGVSEGELESRLRAAGITPLPSATTLRRLVADGLADDVAEAFVEAARQVRSPAESVSDFRSVPERFLFEQLESLPETAGLFRPNAALPFHHGPQTAEADLLADRLKVVVELDGGHYHLNPPQYRRDRRKDWLYQRHGYIILRFLAEDVVDDLETILNTILAAVAVRRDQPSLKR